MPTAGKEQAMSEVPPTAARHLPVPRGACSFHSENPGNLEGFWQSTDEFSLDIAPRSKALLRMQIRNVDTTTIQSS